MVQLSVGNPDVRVLIFTALAIVLQAPFKNIQAGDVAQRNETLDITKFL